MLDTGVPQICSNTNFEEQHGSVDGHVYALELPPVPVVPQVVSGDSALAVMKTPWSEKAFVPKIRVDTIKEPASSFMIVKKKTFNSVSNVRKGVKIKNKK